MNTVLVPLRGEAGGVRGFTVHSSADVAEILDDNAKLRTIEQKSDWGRHVATIPNILQVKWLNEEWVKGNNIRYLSPEWDDLLKRKINDPDYAYLRTDLKGFHVGYGD